MYDSKQQSYTKIEYDLVRDENTRLREAVGIVARNTGGGAVTIQWVHEFTTDVLKE